jgi:integron integrase
MSRFLMDFANVLGEEGCSARTVDTYVGWAERYIRFHDLRHPKEMGAGEVRAFVDHLALDRQVAASTQNQAVSALTFLYEDFMEVPLGDLGDVRAKRRKGVPATVSRDEALAVIGWMYGSQRLAAQLCFGAGLRLVECLTLRVRDVDFEKGNIYVRSDESRGDRSTMLPETLVDGVRLQLDRARVVWREDVERSRGGMPLDGGMRFDWDWWWLFPSPRLSDDDEGRKRRWHLHESTVQRAVREAAKKAGVSRRVTPSILRNSFAVALFRRGENARVVQKLMGHASIRSTLRYKRCLAGQNVVSPLDRLEIRGNGSREG